MESDSKPLSELRPSTKMESTGNVFDPNFYLIDSVTLIVYRKEQFVEGNQLPTELVLSVIADTECKKIEDMCRKVGFEVIWSRFVQSGHWDVALAGQDSRAKEILVFCQKPLSALPTV